MNRSLLFLFFIISCLSFAQKPQKPTSAEIYEDIKKLNFLGTALYIAAHPDDENTSLISFLANNVKARTGYLSLTRGDGGQNLIGPEIRELLGVIRTQELLAARRTDGGEQLFTRANDFGYSRHPDETLAIWNKEAVLSDVVLAIRKFKPDIIINRFSHKPETFGKTHGHHTSSAVLSQLAFDLVGDPTKYKNQLNKVEIWQPQRLFFNTSWWFYGSQDNFDKADKSKLLKLDIGTFYPSFGLSNSEISSLSRSMHKSQGFGSTGSRGERTEYLEIIKGDLPKYPNNLFEGINTTWSRVSGGQAIGTILTNVENNFDFKNPSASVYELIKAYNLIHEIADDYWRVQKIKEIKVIIMACTGLYIEAAASEATVTADSDVLVKIEAINRSNLQVKLNSVRLQPLNISNTDSKKLLNNKRVTFELNGVIPSNIKYTSPYWLTDKGTLGMYKVSDKKMIGVPETPRILIANFNVEIEGVTFDFKKDIVYKYNDPVKGEVYKPLEVVPVVTSSISDKVIIFSTDEPKQITVKIKAGKSDVKGKISLNYPNDWMVTPKFHTVKIAKKGAEQTVQFKVTPPKYQSEGTLKPVVEIDGKIYTDVMVEIDYDHIPFQSVLMPSESKIVRLNIQKKGQLIGYVQGAGDEIPASLRQVGYTVIELNEDEITLDKITKFDAIVIGVRAYNTNNKTKYYQDYLHTYVKNGGTLMVQYNTSHQLKVDAVSPIHLKLGRGRVTDEFSEVKITNPNHEVMKFPNKITTKDFEGWVQERGLYFPREWSDEFSTILSMHDTGKPAEKGSLLIAKYGKGYFIYTGLSFFRELPAGVPGAYRLYANLLSIGKNN